MEKSVEEETAGEKQNGETHGKVEISGKGRDAMKLWTIKKYRVRLCRDLPEEIRVGQVVIWILQLSRKEENVIEDLMSDNYKYDYA